ncbi:MAG TPA: hypothetical protein VID67_07690 [Rhizomicrobium sp.]
MKQRNARSLDLTILAVFALASLSGCIGMSNRPPSVAPPPGGVSALVRVVPQQHTVAVKPKRSPPRDMHAADLDAPITVASIDPQSLLGLDPDGVQKRLGAPARMENSALSRKWIYAAPGCSFSIFFYPNVNSTSFRALKYGSAKDGGESIDSSDTCVRKILTARNNAD